jgi:hypothetical protein
MICIITLSQIGIGPSITVKSYITLFYSSSYVNFNKLKNYPEVLAWITGIPFTKWWSIEWVCPEITPSITESSIEFKN